MQTQREDVGGTRRQHLRPDLGIWDCRIQSATADNTAMLLQRVIINKKGGHSNKKEQDEDNKDNEEKKEADSAMDEATTDDMELPPTVVLTVDTTNPNSVQPSLEQMRKVLLTMMSADETSSKQQLSRESIRTTTSMKVLQSSPFGVTKITESVGSLQDSSKRVAIIIAAIVASSSSSSDGKSAAEEFKERQAKSLVLYHLHKFALECDCTLCFVRDDDDTDDGLAEGIQKLSIGDDTVKKDSGEGNDDTTTNEAQKKSALSIDELGKVIRRVAMGLSPVEEQDLTNEEGGESKSTDDDVAAVASSEISAIHAPGSHDAELIHGAYLRNASCEGQWDASKDDLIVALPPQSTSSDTSLKPKEETKESSTTTSGGGDEEWLSKLAASVGLTPEAITASSQGGDASAATASTTPSGKKSPKRERPAVKKRTTRATSSKNKDAKPKDQKEVMNFFDDLLKK